MDLASVVGCPARAGDRKSASSAHTHTQAAAATHTRADVRLAATGMILQFRPLPALIGAGSDRPPADAESKTAKRTRNGTRENVMKAEAQRGSSRVEPELEAATHEICLPC
jgi:hypothetical protein